MVVYLCTRVSCSTEADKTKLDHLIRYLKRTLNDVRVIGVHDLKTLLCWIDAAYAVYLNMRGQTGGMMSFGTGVIHGRSSKQKLNSKSSSESEKIAVSEYLPFHIWVKNFLKYQGYEVKDNIIFQDNQSAIRLETNGRNSCTGNSRHIDIRYFFVKDWVDKGEFRIEYCNSDNMIADFFTKLLQGHLFRKFRDFIMGYVNIPEKYFTITKIKEDVGLSNQKNIICCDVETLDSKKKRGEPIKSGTVKGTQYIRATNSTGHDKEKGGKEKDKGDSPNAICNLCTDKGIRRDSRKVLWSDIVSGKSEKEK